MEEKQERAFQNLGSSTEKTRNAAVKALSRVESPEISASLIALLQSSEMRERESASKALGRRKEAGAIPALLDALNDRNFQVRAAAASALGRIGDMEALEPLVGTLLDRSNQVRIAAGRALGALGDARAIEPLFEAIRTQPTNCLPLLKALKGIRDERVVEGLLPYIEEADLAPAVMRFFADLGGVALEPLARLVSSPETRGSAIRVLRFMETHQSLRVMILLEPTLDLSRKYRLLTLFLRGATHHLDRRATSEQIRRVCRRDMNWNVMSFLYREPLIEMLQFVEGEGVTLLRASSEEFSAGSATLLRPADGRDLMGTEGLLRPSEAASAVTPSRRLGLLARFQKWLASRYQEREEEDLEEED